MGWIPVAIEEESNLGDLLKELEKCIGEQKQLIDSVANKEE